MQYLRTCKWACTCCSTSALSGRPILHSGQQYRTLPSLETVILISPIFARNLDFFSNLGELVCTWCSTLSTGWKFLSFSCWSVSTCKLISGEVPSSGSELEKLLLFCSGMFRNIFGMFRILFGICSIFSSSSFFTCSACRLIKSCNICGKLVACTFWRYWATNHW